MTNRAIVTHRYFPGSFALTLLLVLAGCGGGSDTPEPVPPLVGPDRIEPFDPGTLAKRASAPPAAPAPAAPLLPRGQAIPTLTLGPIASPLAKSSMVHRPGVPQQIGQGRELPGTTGAADTAALLRWQPSSRGTQVAGLRFVVQGALGMRLGVQVDALPPGAQLRFYGSNDAVFEVMATQLRDIATENAAGGASETQARTYWGPEIVGEQGTLEVEIPADTPSSDVRIAVPRLSHIVATPRDGTATGSAGFCEVNVACSADAIEQGRSVARMHFVEASSGDAFECTGTLLNDMHNSGTPYLLSAYHCISDAASASTLITNWLWRASACKGTNTDDTHVTLSRGATLLHVDQATDTSFMRLNDPAPAGVVYAGSYLGPDTTAGTAISVVHHPEGDIQKISLGTLRGYSNCTADTCTSSDDSGNFLTAQWTQGVVEPGSSGAGAFITLGSSRYVIGQLFGGTSTCNNPNGSDYFGRLELSYRKKLHEWLNP